MTETKIKFKITALKKIPSDQLEPGNKGLEFNIETETLGSSFFTLGSGSPPLQEFTFEKIAFVFKNNAEQNIYNALLNGKNEIFELKFDRAEVKISLNYHGFGDFIDPTKPEIKIYPVTKKIIVFLESRFAGIIAVEKAEYSVKELEEKLKKLTNEISKLKEQINIYLVVSIVLGITIIVGAIAFVYNLKKSKTSPNS